MMLTAAMGKARAVILRAGPPMATACAPAWKQYRSRGEAARHSRTAPPQPDTHRQSQAEPDGPGDPARGFGSVVVAEDGDEAVAHPEDGHKDKGLNLEVDPQHEHPRLGPQGEQLVEAQGHEAGQGLHDHGGGGDAQHLPPRGPGWAGSPGRRWRTPRRMRHSRKKPMQAPEICPITVATAAPATPMSQAEDEHRVQDDVQHRPGALDDHKAGGVPGGLEQPLGQKTACTCRWTPRSRW